MTDTSKTNRDDDSTVTVDARVRGEKKVRPWNAVLWRALGELVAFLPSHRDTREGRKKKKQMRVLIVAVGIGLMAIGGTADAWGGFWIILGIFLACLAFVAPVEELKKRTWRGRIKKNQKPRARTVWTAGSIVFDGRRVELRDDSEQKVRRVRVDRGKHELTQRKSGERRCLGILPPGGKTEAGIWVCTEGSVDGDWEGSVDDDEMDRPATVDARDWERLWEALNEPA